MLDFDQDLYDQSLRLAMVRRIRSEIAFDGVDQLKAQIARDLAEQAALDPYRGAELSPGPDVKTDDQIDGWIRKTVSTAHHPCGTCAMGVTEDAVLDADLRVRGLDGLRVADAAAMPDLVSGAINASVIMIAEKAADLIRGRDALPPAHDLPAG